MKALIRALGCGLMMACALTTARSAVDVIYSYDTLGRLQQVSYPSGKSITYSYDAAGNRTSVVSVGANAAPTANNDSAMTNDNTAIALDPRINDTDPDGDTLAITAPGGTAAATAHGSVTGTSNLVTYTPTNGFHGTDSFGYTISDGHGHSASATVTVNVNSPPVAVYDHVTASPSVTFDPTANDTDPDGDTLSVKSVGSPAAPFHGTIVKNSGTSVTYTANSGYHGVDNFSYTIKDGQGHTATTTDQVTVP